MKCYSAPYEGDGEYIFFSYCHDDAAQVYPIIERLSIEGFRVWFDSGIHTGVDWPDVIATHLNKAGIMVAAFSRASAESLNCRNEITYAIGNNIKILAVMLEKVKLSPAAKMQLSNSQYIRKYEIEDSFYDELINAPALSGFREENGKAGPEELETWRHHAERYSQDIPTDSRLPEPDCGTTVKDQLPIPAVLFRTQTGEAFPLKKKNTVIGRRHPENKVEISLSNNAEISRRHARITRQNKAFFLQDLDSTNGTLVNGKPADSGETIPLGDAATIGMGGEEFLFVNGESIKNPVVRGSLGLLKSVRTGELRLIRNDRLFLDRDHPWKGGVLGSVRISRKTQTQIIYFDGGFRVEDLDSPNGTYLNGTRLYGEKAELNSGDIISAVNEEFVFYEIPLGDLREEKPGK